ADGGEGGGPTGDEGARISRREGVLEIGGGTDARDLPAAEFAREHPAEALAKLEAAGVPLEMRSGSREVEHPQHGLGASQSLHRQLQTAGTLLADPKQAPHQIGGLTPGVQHYG